MEWASEGYIREIGLERFNDWITGGDLGLRHGHPGGGGAGSAKLEICRVKLEKVCF